MAALVSLCPVLLPRLPCEFKGHSLTDVLQANVPLRVCFCRTQPTSRDLRREPNTPPSLEKTSQPLGGKVGTLSPVHPEWAAIPLDTQSEYADPSPVFQTSASTII